MTTSTSLFPVVPLDAALEYLRRKWYSVPIPFRCKGPVIKGWQHLRITADEARKRFAKKQANIGVLLGEPSDWLVDVDIDCAEALALAPDFLPATAARFGRASKPESHWLYHAAAAKSEKFETVDGMLVEIRSTRLQTVFPPGVHPQGEPIEWSQFGEPARISKTELSASVARLAAATLLVRQWPAKGSGLRHKTALALAGMLLRGGTDPDRAADFLRRVAEVAGDEEVDDRVACVGDTQRRLQEGGEVTGVPTLAELIGNDVTKAVTNWLGLQDSAASTPNSNRSDVGNRKRFVQAYGEEVHFSYEQQKWYCYDGTRWALDRTGAIERYATLVAEAIVREAKAIENDGERKAMYKWALASQHRARIEAMIWCARSVDPIRQEELDRDPFLLNVLNGTLDLRTGVLRPHDRQDFISRLAPVAYDPKARAPKWLAFLKKIMNGNTRLVAYLQRVLGYAATGDTREQVFFLLYGTGANGKSTFLETVLFVLGEDYGQPTEFRTFLYRDRGDGVRNDLAALVGLRMVTAVEADPGKRLDEALIKQVSGGDRISARFLFREFFTYVPQFKLFLAANHKPEIRGVEEAIWRRIRHIPFAVTIPKQARNRKLAAELREEAPGILAWIVEGALAWQRTGLSEPKEITRATEGYRQESDVLADFVGACTEPKEGEVVLVGVLYAVYVVWAGAAGTEAWKKDTFSKAMVERGLVVKHRRVGQKTLRVYLNLALTEYGGELHVEAKDRAERQAGAGRPGSPW